MNIIQTEQIFVKKLLQLQQSLKKQFLLIEKEQQQKTKIKKEIQQSIRAYFSVFIEMENSQNMLQNDDGFDNCYNFIKDVLVMISQNVELGKELLLSLPVSSPLNSLFVNILYESVESTDPYYKDITRLVGIIIQEIYNPKRDQSAKQKIASVIKQYMKKNEIAAYFQAVAGQLLKRVSHIKFRIRQKQDLTLIKSDALSLNQIDFDRPNEHSHRKDSCESGTNSLAEDNPKLSIAERESLNHLQTFEQKKAQIAEQYIKKIFAQADLCPQSIKIPLKACLESVVSFNALNQKKKDPIQQIWNMVGPFYLKPLIEMLDRERLSEQSKDCLKQVILYLTKKYEMCENYRCDVLDRTMRPKLSPAIEKIVKKLLIVNEDKYRKYILNEKEKETSNENNELQIRIYGACISYSQLQQLMRAVVENKLALAKINQRVVSRASKIFQISPNLEVFNLNLNPKKGERNGSQHYVILNQMKYSEMIECDYHKKYTTQYKDQAIKNIFRQVLVEMDFISRRYCKITTNSVPPESKKGIEKLEKEELPSNKKQANYNGLKYILQAIIREAERGQKNGQITVNQNMNSVSAQLLMKLKYIVYLLSQKDTPQKLRMFQQLLINQMIAQAAKRAQQSIKLYEETKFSLLKVFCNIKHYRSSLKSQRQSQKKIDYKLKLISLMDELKFQLCLTSPSSRNSIPQDLGFSPNKSMEDPDTANKYKYRIASSQDIIVADWSECIHKDNAFTGLKSHAASIVKFIDIFAKLREVKHCISSPQFLYSSPAEVSKAKLSIESCVDKSKIKAVLFAFINTVFVRIKQANELSEYGHYYEMITSVVMRAMGELLVSGSQGEYDLAEGESKVNLIVSSKDSLFLQRTKQISHIKASIRSSPKANGGQKQQVSTQQSFQQRMQPSSIKSIIQQVIQIGSKFINHINSVRTPLEKAKKLKEIIDIYKTILLKYDEDKIYSLQWMLYKTLVRAKPLNFITNLAFTELFLSQEKLLSSEGKVLDLFKRVSKKIYYMEIEDNLQFQFSDSISIHQGTSNSQAITINKGFKDVISEGSLSREIQRIRQQHRHKA